MKVLLASHGYPPELQGGTERSVRALAQALATAGHTVSVVAGSLRPGSGAVELSREHDGPVEVLRLHRPDLHFDHWHKGRSPEVAARFGELCRELAPDVVHVHHWLRLSTDLVVSAARAGVPAVASLHDAWTSCPLAFRVRPDTRAACTTPVGPLACVPCAARVAPHTLWVSTEAGFVRLATRQQELELELRSARVLSAPSRAHADALEPLLGLAPGSLGLRIVPPAREPLVAIAREPLAAPAELGRLVVGAWGHLLPHKGPDLLLEALALAQSGAGEAGLEVELHLAGAAPDARFEAALRERARDLRVTFHGAFRPADLPGHPVTRVHAMVSGSRAAESHGCVCDEARDLGLPLLLPRSGAFTERAGAGAELYTPGDAADLARLFARAAREPALLERLRGELASSAPGPDDGVATWLELYREAIDAGAPEVPAVEWFEARMQRHALEEWDRDLERSEAAT